MYLYLAMDLALPDLALRVLVLGAVALHVAWSYSGVVASSARASV